MLLNKYNTNLFSSMSNKTLNVQDIQQYFADYNDMFTDIYQKLKVRVNDKLDNINNFIELIVQTLCLLTENNIDLHGFQKKELTIDLVKKLIADMNVSDDEKQILNKCVFYTLDNTVDLLIATAKGYLFLKKVEDEVEEQTNKCFSLFKKQNVTRNKAKDMLLPIPKDQDIADVVYDKLKEVIQNKTIDATNIISIATLAMQLVQQFAGMSGADKKACVIKVITRLVGEIPMSDDNRAALQAIIATTLDKTIDFIISVANGDINIVQIVKDNVEWCKTTCCNKSASNKQ